MSRELDLINAMLATTGATALSAADTRHPNYIEAKNVLDRVSDDLFSKELWFNTELVTLHPDTSGKIRIPSDATNIDPVDECLNVVEKGEYLWDVTNQTFKFAEPLPCRVQKDFNDLANVPKAAINYLRAASRYEFYLDQDGEQVKLMSYMRRMERAEVDFINEQFKNLDANRLDQSRLNLRSNRDVIAFNNRPSRNNWL